MPRVRCFYLDCVFLDDGFCSAVSVEIDPDEGCITYKRSSDFIEDEIVEEEWEALGFDEADEDDVWLDDDF
jgi:hypothetical protein